MSIESKAKRTREIEEEARKVYYELVWGKRDEKGEYHGLSKSEYDEKSTFYHSQQWVPLVEAQKEITEAIKTREVKLWVADGKIAEANKILDERYDDYWAWYRRLRVALLIPRKESEESK
jgi:hypothetical protein